MVSKINLYSGGKGAELVKSDLVSLSFYESKGKDSREEYKIKGLEKEITVVVPRAKGARPERTPSNLEAKKYMKHSFNVTQNASAVHIRVEWEVRVEVELYIKKGSEPKPAEGVYDFNETLKLEGHFNVNSSNSSDPTSSELFLSNDALNWTAAGPYFVQLRYKANGSLPEEEKDKMDSNGAVPYNFSVYTSICMYYDENKKSWSTEGTKVR